MKNVVGVVSRKKLWMAPDVETIVGMYEHGCTIKDIAKSVKATPEQVSDKIYALRKERKIIVRRDCKWSPEEITKLKSMCEHKVPLCDMALSLGRSKDAVRDKMKPCNRSGKRIKRQGMFIDGQIEVSNESGVRVARIKISNGYLFKHNKGIYYGTDENIVVGL